MNDGGRRLDGCVPEGREVMGGTDACRGCSFKFVQTDEIQEEAGLVSLLTFKEDTSSEIQRIDGFAWEIPRTWSS